MKALLLLGGFHPEMPLAEARSLGLRETKRYERLAVGETDNWEVLKRLGYSHLVLDYLGSFKLGEGLSFDPEELIEDRSAARVKNYDFEGDFEGAKSEILHTLEPHIDEVDLRSPDMEIYFFLAQDKIRCGRLLHEFDSSDFFKRKSGLRPFSRPISLPPRESRCWVNLSGVKENEKLLDPFCGTGGILMEAGLMGCELYGSDSEQEMASGCEINLDYYGLDAELKVTKAQDLSERWNEKFDAIVTDPPYGRATNVGGEEIEEVYRESLREFEKVLREGKRCVLGAPRKIDFQGMVESSDFKTMKKFKEKVHGSLVREIFVLENSN